MSFPQLVAALRPRSPEALLEVPDTHGDRLFSYRWRLLRNRGNAQIAGRDGLVIASAQIGRQACGEWLMARTAIMGLAAGEAEALGLDFGHDVDLGLSAESLIGQNQACPYRAKLLSGWTGISTAALRVHLLEHAANCSLCGLTLPPAPAACAVALPPAPAASAVALPPAPAFRARLKPVESFGEAKTSACRKGAVSRAVEAGGSWLLNQPEPTGPALSVEQPVRAGPPALPGPPGSGPASRVAPAVFVSGDAAPPAGSVPAGSVPAGSVPAGSTPARRRRLRVFGVGVAAMASVTVIAVVVLAGFRVIPSAVTASGPAAAATPRAGSAPPRPGGGASAVPVRPGRAASRPAGHGPGRHAGTSRLRSPAVGASQPGSASQSRPARPGGPRMSPSTGASSAAGSLAVKPVRLNLGSGPAGLLTLTAVGGPVSWSASTSSALVALSSLRGTLQAGWSVTLVVTVIQAAGSRGEAFVVIDSAPVGGTHRGHSAAPPASQAVVVIWAATDGPSSPQPSPSASSSPSPFPTLSYSRPASRPPGKR